MPFTYQRCEREFAKRKKGSDTKTVLRNCTLRKQGDDFLISMQSWNYRITQNELTPMARISPDNIVTLLYDKDVDMTVCNRLQSIGGLAVRLNKREYSAYKQHVRVYQYDSWANSMPYFAGLQVNVAGKPHVVNPQPDVRIVLDRSVVTKAKNEFAQIRKLAKVMLRINAFENLYLDNHCGLDYDKLRDAKPLSQVNAEEPTMDDVRAVVAAGNRVATGPRSYVYDPVARRYTTVAVEELRRGYLESCIEHGLRLLRREFYKANDGYVEQAQAA